MNSIQHTFGLYSFHNFDSRIVFITDRVSFLEWIREAAAEYDFRITENLVTSPGWSDMNNSTCVKFQMMPNISLVEHTQIDSSVAAMNRLCVSWAEQYKFIAAKINHLRRHVGIAETFNFQSVIYQEKLKEAQNIQLGNVDNLKFLNLEANYKNISLEDLANQVVLQNDMFMGYLSRTEFLRIKWLGKLQCSKSLEEHQQIRKEFLKELYDYHRLS
jgi:hypothetical protein